MISYIAQVVLTTIFILNPINAEFSCIHDQLHHERPELRQVVTNQVNTPPPSGARRLAQAPEDLPNYNPADFSAIRIHAEYKLTDLTDVPKKTFLQNTLMPAAIRRWTEALSVKPVVGPLYAARQCAAEWPTTPRKCAAFQPASTCNNNGDEVDLTFTPTELGPDTYYPTDPNIADTAVGGSGYANTDMLIYVTAKQTTACGASTLAYANTCQRLADDRPSIARINFCPNSLNVNTTAFRVQLYTAIHELGHALGYTSESFALFRYANGTARTPRSDLYPNKPADRYSVATSCGGNSYNFSVPATNTVGYFNERGASCTYPTSISTPDNCVMKLVTPTVKKATQWFFDCNSLAGAELENGDTSSCYVQGSHWERRIFRYEFINPYILSSVKLSPITLAAFHDSGWYYVNFSTADDYQPAMDYGFKQGCSFATDKCNVATSSPAHFLQEEKNANYGTAMCAVDHMSVGYVAINTFGSSLPTRYQYFSNPLKGGDSTADYCPVVQEYSNMRCLDGTVSWAADVGQIFGTSSRCHNSTLTRTGILSSFAKGAGCHPTTCVSKTQIDLQIAPQVGTYPYNLTCTTSDVGVLKTVPGYNGYIKCPDPAVFCADDQRFTLTVPSPAATPSVSSTRSVTPTHTASAMNTPSFTPSTTVSGAPSAPATSSPSVTPNVNVYQNVTYNITLNDQDINHITNANATVIAALEAFVGGLCGISKDVLLNEAAVPTTRVECVAVGYHSDCSSQISFTLPAANCHVDAVVAKVVIQTRKVGESALDEEVLKAALESTFASSSALTQALQQSSVFNSALGSNSAAFFEIAGRASVGLGVQSERYIGPSPAAAKNAEDSGLSQTTIIIIVVAGGGGVLLILIICGCCYCRKRPSPMTAKGTSTTQSNNNTIDAVESGPVSPIVDPERGRRGSNRASQRQIAEAV